MKRIILLLILANFLNGSWIFEGNAKKGGYILAVNQDTGEKQKAYVISKENDVALCEIDEIGEVKVKVIEPKKKPRVIVYQSSPSERERARQAQYYQNFDNPYDHLTAYGPDGSEIGDQYGWNVSGFLKGMRETKRALREQDIERENYLLEHGYATADEIMEQNREKERIRQQKYEDGWRRLRESRAEERETRTKIQTHGTETEYGYEGISGNRYKYDLSKPGDRLRYENDPSAKLRDETFKPTNAGALMDEAMGQYGGGLEY